MFVLTDELAVQYYCGCLVFHESVAMHTVKNDDDDIDDESLNSMELSYPNLMRSSVTKGNFSQSPKPNTMHQMMYAPKGILLISRQNYPEIIKNCLTVIYTVYIDNVDVKLEVLITNLLAGIEVPKPGGSEITFSLGANDRQVLQPPLSKTIPLTSTVVFDLFDQLGICAAVNVVLALMTENKVLILSRSFTQIYNASQAMIALMYPFVYSHVYIPILPIDMLDFVSSPTPFLMGTHSSVKNQTQDIIDVILVDLDEGSVTIPDSVLLPKLDESLHSQLINHLCLVLRPQLSQADNAFPSSQTPQSPPVMLDKEIRAIFLRTFTQLLQGYRSCLTVSRIYPETLITFNQASFLSQRNYVNNDFVIRLLECVCFSTFVQNRGKPYRPCDLFDDLYSTLHNIIKEEYKNPELTLKHIKELANQIYANECPNSRLSSNSSSASTKIPMPTEGAFTRVHLPPFPLLDSTEIQELIETECIKREIPSISDKSSSTDSSPEKVASASCNTQRIVPMGLPINLYNEMIGLQSIALNSARRLEVMRKCISSVFENKIHDARKTLNAVLLALRTKAARLALCEELNKHAAGNKAILEQEQFNLVVRLMNCALQDNSEIDINEIAAVLLPLAMKFCRRLSTNVMQFAYTCIQDHDVWSSTKFWEQTFYLDVEKEIKNLYKGGGRENNNKSLSPEHQLDNSEISKQFSDFVLQDSALEIAAQQMRLYDKTPPTKVAEYTNQENSTIYAQTIHYINIIVSLKVPFDISTRGAAGSTAKHAYEDNLDSHSISNFTNNSAALDESGGAGGAIGGGGGGAMSNQSLTGNEYESSGFEESSEGYHLGGYHNSSPVAGSEVANSIIKFISRFVDKVANESQLLETHIKQLHNYIPQAVAMHIESLEPVWKESRHLPPMPKPKILLPHTLPGEEFVVNNGLRSYLVFDGKEESSTGVVGGTQLLPAEGAIFLTNYRVIFKGRPTDSYASESVIVRSFPVATITKEKRIAITAIPSLDQCLQEGIQIKSNTFQVLKVAFDEEVALERIEEFRKMLSRERAPPNIFHHFAFTSQLGVHHTKQLFQQKNKKKKTIQGITKKTLMRTAEKVGFKTKGAKEKKNKYAKDMNGFYSMTIAAGASHANPPSRYFGDDGQSSGRPDGENSSMAASTDNLSQSALSGGNAGNNITITNSSISGLGGGGGGGSSESRSFHRLHEMLYVKDYERLGFSVYSLFYMASVSGSKLSKSVAPSYGGGGGGSSGNGPSNSNMEYFRISSVNIDYSVCRSYPGLVVVPYSTNDESIKRLARCYRLNRFPAIVWKHPRNRCLILRSSAFHNKGMIGLFKGGPTSVAAAATSSASGAAKQIMSSSSTAHGTTSSSSSSSANHHHGHPLESSQFEQERFLKLIASFTASQARLNHYNNSSNHHLNTNRLSDNFESASINSFSMNSPESGRRALPPLGANVAGKVKNSKSGFQPFLRTFNLRNSSGKSSSIGQTMGRQLIKITNNVGLGGGKDKEKKRKDSIISTTGSTGGGGGLQSKKNSFILVENEKADGSSNLNLHQAGTAAGNASGASVNSSASSNSLNCSSTSSLYIIAEKSQVRMLKPREVGCNYEFFPIEMHEVRHVKASFKKLLKVCVPSEPKSGSGGGGGGVGLGAVGVDVSATLGGTFLRDFISTEWLKQIQTIMYVASIIVELVDNRSASVILSLEEGADLVPQIISIAELCLDPYYRTFEGFRALIEKEWLAFGHRFTHRSNLINTSLSSGFAPIFLQFLDVVHQIHAQFPLSFEFNQYYIKFIAYHYVSCRFRTFLHDCECDRADCGWIDEDIKTNLSLRKLMTEDDDELTELDDDEELNLSSKLGSGLGLNSSMAMNSANMGGKGGNNTSSFKGGSGGVPPAPQFNHTGTSFWDYAGRVWVKSPIFFNFHYVPVIVLNGHHHFSSSQEEAAAGSAAIVLRPLFNLASLKIWDYYVGEELAHGPSYDLEVVQMERHRQEELEMNPDYDKVENHRIVVNAIYDSVEQSIPNSFIEMLDHIKLLEAELNFCSQRWSRCWDKIEIPTLNLDAIFIEQQQKQQRQRQIRSPPSGKAMGTTSYGLQYR